MRKHAVFAAFAIVSALAIPHQVQAKAAPGIIVCDRQGCRPESPPRAAGRAASDATKASRTTRHSGQSHKAHPEPSLAVSAPSGIVRSGKTGATARVAARYAARFQAYIDDLEAHGARVYYMGGIRPGHCSEGSQHPCGKALDVCQDWRGHVSAARDCNLPGPVEMAAIARSHGLFEGGVWCRNPDYGHAQVDRTGSECVARGTSGHGTTKIVSARRHHRHHRIKVARR